MSQRKILAAFDQNHFLGFRKRFLRSLRSSGNDEEVIAVTYGLSEEQNRALERHKNVSVRAKDATPQPPAIRRLKCFYELVESFPSETVVAFWDAADVLFQAHLGDLWALAEAYPEQVLVNTESQSAASMRARDGWIKGVRSQEASDWLSQVCGGQRFLNSGFGVGSAAAMRRYFLQAYRVRHTPLLLGTGGWDQMALNLLQWYVSPELFQVIESDWNYCMHGRSIEEINITENRIYRASDQSLIPVVHANGQTLKGFWLEYERSHPRRQPKSNQDIDPSMRRLASQLLL